ncbi:MAG: cache domain-containing protein [Desulfovibrio sp.]
MLSFFASGINEEVLEDPVLINAVRKEWANYISLDRDRWYIYFADLEGHIIVEPQWTPPAGYDPRTRPWYKKALEQKGRTGWTTPYKEYTTGKPVVTVARTVEDHAGKILGVMGIDTQVGVFIKRFSSLQLGTGGKLYLVDPSGVVLAESGSSSFGMNVKNEPWFSLISHNQSGSLYYPEGDAQKVISFVKEPVTGWYIAGFSSLGPLEDSVDTLWVYLITGALFLWGCLALVAAYIARRLGAITGDLQQSISAVNSSTSLNEDNHGFPEIAAMKSELMALQHQVQTSSWQLDGVSHSGHAVHTRWQLLAELKSALGAHVENVRPCSLLLISFHGGDSNMIIKNEYEKFTHEFEQIIIGAVRDCDFVAETQPQEYGVLFFSTDIDMTILVAQRMLRSLSGLGHTYFSKQCFFRIHAAESRVDEDDVAFLRRASTEEDGVVVLNSLLK